MRPGPLPLLEALNSSLDSRMRRSGCGPADVNATTRAGKARNSRGFATPPWFWRAKYPWIFIYKASELRLGPRPDADVGDLDRKRFKLENRVLDGLL